MISRICPSRWPRAGVVLSALIAATAARAQAPAALGKFVTAHCVECHDADTKEGGLDLASLAFAPAEPKNFAAWVRVHDRVAAGEMPPPKRERPAAPELSAFTDALRAMLTTSERERFAARGRAVQRRLNRYEYENTLRDLLHAPWLQVKALLPEDEEARRFNKIGEALDVSYVNLQHYLGAAEYALREVMAAGPPTRTLRYHARDEESFTSLMRPNRANGAIERATFPLLGTAAQPDVRAGKQPLTAGARHPETRDREAIGVLSGPYDFIEPAFRGFRAPVGGRYRVRLNAFSIWVGADKDPARWWIPDPDNVSPGRRPEPVTLYGQSHAQPRRPLGTVEITPTPAAYELEAWLLAGETIQPDPVRLFRTNEREGRFRNPLAERDGQPGVAYRWLEVEGPLYDASPTRGQEQLFADLPLTRKADRFEATSKEPAADAARLIRRFVARAYRRPIGGEEWKRFMPVVEAALKDGDAFTDAMLEGYAAVLVSPEFIGLKETPGRLDDYALATRLSYFLWNSPPDEELRRAADSRRLRDPVELRAQAERLLTAPKAQRFVEAFLDYWLDLRKLGSTAPDRWLYPEYFADEYLTESAAEETRRFFAELVRADLPARNVVASDFAVLNERLALLYGVPGVSGVTWRKVALPVDGWRGGLITQASVLKVTANGTTTSPVTRGAWMMERILGLPPPPPPAAVPAIEPDTRGATTIREQLEKHRAAPACAACHVKIDPVGYALESFDVMGARRERYRSLGDQPVDERIGRSGGPVFFHPTQAVDSSGRLPDGRAFADVRELRPLLLADEKQIARNLARQLTIYATGAPIGFSDRETIEEILARAAVNGYGVRTLIHEVIQSELFRCK